MKQNQTMRKYFHIGLLVPALMLLPGCTDWFGGMCGTGTKGGGCCGGHVDHKAGSTGAADKVDKSDTTKVLATLNGKAIITEKKLEEYFEQLVKENPQFAQMMAFMPDNVKYNLLQGMMHQEAMELWVKEQGMDKSAEYQRELERLVVSVKRMLDAKYFAAAHPVQVAEADIQKFYDENKDKHPALLVSQGGVKAVGVSFDKEDAAKDFMSKINDKVEVKKLAEDAGLGEKFKDFKAVNDESLGMDAEVKTAITEAKKFPSNKIVKTKDAVWVVRMTGKEDRQYRALAEIRNDLTEYLKREKEGAEVQKQLDIFEKAHNMALTVQEDYFKNQKGDQAAMMPQDMQVAMMQDDAEQAS